MYPFTICHKNVVEISFYGDYLVVDGVHYASVPVADMLRRLPGRSAQEDWPIGSSELLF